MQLVYTMYLVGAYKHGLVPMRSGQTPLESRTSYRRDSTDWRLASSSQGRHISPALKLTFLWEGKKRIAHLLRNASFPRPRTHTTPSFGFSNIVVQFH